MPFEQSSEIQRRMYDFIVNYMKSEGMPPTNREIGRELQIPNTGHVDYHLTKLEKKGLISRQPKRSRGIKLRPSPTGIPVMGSIAAGEPLDIFTDATEHVDIDHGAADTENAYALIVRGCSMIEDYIYDGDYVVIKPQSTCQNGDIVVAVHMQEGMSGSATLKRFFQEEDHDRVRLQPANSELGPILIPKSVWDREWQVQGKVVAIFRKFTDNQLTHSSPSTYPISEESTNNTIDNVHELIKENSNELKELINQLKDQVRALESKSLKYLENPEGSETSTAKQPDPKSIVEDKGQLIETADKIAAIATQQGEVYERISKAVKTDREQLNQIYEQGNYQAKQWFQCSLVAATITFIVIIAGAAIAIFTATNIAGILTSIASIVPAAMATLFYRQAKDANRRLDDFYEKLIEIEEINRAVELALTCSDDGCHPELCVKKSLPQEEGSRE